MNFEQALALVKEEFNGGHILAYSVEVSFAHGLQILVETDQGWNPNPFWEEFPGDDDPMRYL